MRLYVLLSFEQVKVTSAKADKFGSLSPVQAEFNQLVACINITDGQGGSQIKCNRGSLVFLLHQIHVVRQRVTPANFPREDAEEHWGRE